MESFTSNYGPWASLALRIAIGILFMVHGFPKLFGGLKGGKQGVRPFAQFLAQIGIPAPLFFAVVVGGVEFFGGALLILGLATRIAAFLLAVNMAVATWRVKWKMGLVNGYELDLILLAGNVALLLMGGGRLSVDLNLLGGRI